jgi:hypothetical protein
MLNHIWVVHQDCHRQYCMVCDGGLSLCSVCGGLEGGLPTECPGENMNSEIMDRIYRGEIDFRDGRWQEGVISDNSPAKFRAGGDE